MIHKDKGGVVVADVGAFTIRVSYVWPYSRGVEVFARRRSWGWWWRPKQRRRIAQMLVDVVRRHMGEPDDIVYKVNRRLRSLNKDVIMSLENITHVEEL